VETHRIRVENRTGGAVSVSRDGGETWETVGKIKAPAVSLAPGFTASQWSEDSTVCAVAVHGLRIRVGESEDASRGLLISIVPLEFAKAPENYGGHNPGTSGIYTDIPAGTGVFREFAPFLGNMVLLKQDRGLVPIPDHRKPQVGDVYVIQVARPERLPICITLENRAGGSVIADFGNGEAYEFARVKRPVEGVGRFDATGYTGIGCINTNHAGVVTISTAPDFNGMPRFDTPFGESRGGFMIQPDRHAADEESTGGPVSQVMVIEAVRSGHPLEGTPPLFMGYLGLMYDSNDRSRSYVCEMQVDGGEWEPLVESVGINPSLFTARGLEGALARAGRGRFVNQGVTAFHILFPKVMPLSRGGPV
jgi:hypothetical protein